MLTSYTILHRRLSTEGFVPTPRAILPRAPYRPRRHTTEGFVPTPRAILSRAPYRPRRHTTEGSRASPLRLMRHSIEKNPREGLTWPCAPSNLIVGGSLGSHSPSDLLQVRRRKQRSSGGRNPTRTTVKVPINRTPTVPPFITTVRSRCLRHTQSCTVD
ncbi:hypothetical protein RHGRI_038537 [Rhododendron griersonianum]|uniref:Uncharacterized protein n=1 Tax=Rhododendron griersonianum TaxID=479676 RepID=A0AAV6HIV7_9ERIC|nr:hypothetical protein RHGRI_038537 [Rhododendron griersonianum]